MADGVNIFMPFYVGDYLADTGDLSTEEHGAYMLLLINMWRQDGSLTSSHERLARITGVPPERWGTVWQSIARFFQVNDGTITNRRLTAELMRAKARKESAVAKAKAGAKAKWDHASSNASSNASSRRQALLGTCPPPSPSQSHAPTASKPQEATPRAKRSEGDADLALADTMRASVKDPAPTWTDKVWQRERERYAKAIRLARESDGRSPEMLAELCARWGELPQQTRAWAETHPMDWKRDVAKNHAALPGNSGPVYSPRPVRTSTILPPGFMEIEGQLVRAPAPRVAR